MRANRELDSAPIPDPDRYREPQGPPVDINHIDLENADLD